MRLLALALLTLGLASASELKCSPGEVPDKNNICIQPRFIEGCLQYAQSLICAKCQTFYKLTESGLCEYNKQSNQPCCLSKSQDDKCKKCNTGLKLTSDGACQQNTIIGCLQKNQAGICTNCAADYYLEDGLCSQGIKECVKYLDTNTNQKKKRDLNSDGIYDKICIECKKNFSLVNNLCIKNKILGCESEVNHKCLKCLEPFQLKQNHCQIKNCISYNDFGCTACDCGYFLNFKNLCEEIQPGCIRYQRGVCNDCQANFKLKGTTCVMEGCTKLQFLECKSCQSGYDLVDGGCKLKNCALWDNGICHACDDGYITQNGSCLRDNKLTIIGSA